MFVEPFVAAVAVIPDRGCGNQGGGPRCGRQRRQGAHQGTRAGDARPADSLLARRRPPPIGDALAGQMHEDVGAAENRRVQSCSWIPRAALTSNPQDASRAFDIARQGHHRMPVGDQSACAGTNPDASPGK